MRSNALERYDVMGYDATGSDAIVVMLSSIISLHYIAPQRYNFFLNPQLFGGGDVEELGDLVTNQGLIVDEGIKDL